MNSLTDKSDSELVVLVVESGDYQNVPDKFITELLSRELAIWESEEHSSLKCTAKFDRVLSTLPATYQARNKSNHISHRAKSESDQVAVDALQKHLDYGNLVKEKGAYWLTRRGFRSLARSLRYWLSGRTPSYYPYFAELLYFDGVTDSGVVKAYYNLYRHRDAELYWKRLRKQILDSLSSSDLDAIGCRARQNKNHELSTWLPRLLAESKKDYTDYLSGSNVLDDESWGREIR